MNKILILVWALALVNCIMEKPERNHESTEKLTVAQDSNQEIELPQSQTTDKTTDVLLQNEEALQLKNIAVSFHRWYIKNVNTTASKTPIEVSIVEGEAGKCKVETKLYFDQLRKLGSVSEKFIRQEQERVSDCTKELSKVNWDDYSKADAYEYDKHCGFLYYYYWIQSQEPFSDVEVSSMEIIGNSWNVTLSFFDMRDGKKYYADHYHPVVKLDKEEGEWKITQIT